MKKLLFLFFSSTILFSAALTVEQKIYKSTFNAIFPNKKYLRVWVDDKNKFTSFENIKIVNNIENADILILFKTKSIKTDKMVFIANHRILKSYSKSSLGGFYWQKGRPNLVFFKENLKKFGVKLPKKFKIYIEDD